MRWRFADRIDAFEPWSLIEGHKCVSLEEYSLLEPLGREGEFPESLVLESCVQFVGWLVAASSGFASLAVLHRVDTFAFRARVRAGSRLEVRTRVERIVNNLVIVRCSVTCGRLDVAEGTLSAEMAPSEALCDPAELEMLWTELNGAADRKK